MAKKLTIRPWLVAVTVGGVLTSAQLVTAPRAQGCPAGQVEDSVTRMCWSQSGQGGSGPCLPGRLGSCLGTLEKSAPAAGAKNSAVPCGFGPESGYPCGYWWP